MLGDHIKMTRPDIDSLCSRLSYDFSLGENEFPKNPSVVSDRRSRFEDQFQLDDPIVAPFPVTKRPRDRSPHCSTSQSAGSSTKNRISSTDRSRRPSRHLTTGPLDLSLTKPAANLSTSHDLLSGYESKPRIDFSAVFGAVSDSSPLRCSPELAGPTEVRAAAKRPDQKTERSPENKKRNPNEDQQSADPFSQGVEPKNKFQKINGWYSSAERSADSGKQPNWSFGQSDYFADDFIVSFRDVLDLQLKLDQLQVWIDLKDLRAVVVGCFVRVPIDQDHNEFTIAQIIDLVEREHYPIGRQRTNKHLVLFIPESISDRNLVRMSFVSNRDFSKKEFWQWKTTNRRASEFKLNRQHFCDKTKQLNQIRIEHNVDLENAGSTGSVGR